MDKIIIEGIRKNEGFLLKLLKLEIDELSIKNSEYNRGREHAYDEIIELLNEKIKDREENDNEQVNNA